MQLLTENREEGITLDSLLESLPLPPDKHRHRVRALPVSHLTSARSFEDIVDSGRLEARFCDVFNQKLLYLSYGGIFHRYGAQPTNNAAEYPVAILFSPGLLRRIKCFYPYDTGAANNKKYGDKWSEELMCFEKYRVSSDSKADLLTKLVYYTYGNNYNYLVSRRFSTTTMRRGIAKIDKKEPLRTLIEFINTDLTTEGADHRQSIIECQAGTSLGLREVFSEIEWMGFPANKSKNFYELINKFKETHDRMPDHYAYDSYVRERPSAVATVLEDRARAVVDRYWKQHRGRTY
jgi:hypothetical protein